MRDTTAVRLVPINIISGEVCWLDNSYHPSPTRIDADEDNFSIITHESSSTEFNVEDRDIFLNSDLNRIMKIIDDEKELNIF